MDVRRQIAFQRGKRNNQAVPERVKGCQPQQNLKNQIYCVKNPAADRNLDFFRLFPAHQ